VVMTLRKKRRAKKHTPVNKALLAHGEPVRVRDRVYLDQAPKMICAACSKPAEAAAHIRAGNGGGTGLKPCDRLTEWLCTQCHMTQESNPGALWWYENVRKVPTTKGPEDWLKNEYIPARIRAYDEWERMRR
jgi:hypothetical protein